VFSAYENLTYETFIHHRSAKYSKLGCPIKASRAQDAPSQQQQQLQQQ
jgi:hypothetical protein